MELIKVAIVCVILTWTCGEVCLLDPISSGLAALGAAASIFPNYIPKAIKYIGQKIGYYEGCEDYWIPGNTAELELDLKTNVFGQPVALEMILGAIKRHLDKHNTPKRALMLSFHGPPGTGKNFISKKILQKMFRNEHKSEFLHFFRGSIDFPMKSKIDEYKDKIAKIIKDKVYECRRSIFVFDEVEKMPEGVLDVLSGFVKYGDYDYRRVIFILLSNVGSSMLIRETHNSKNLLVDREDMDYTRITKMLTQEAYNKGGGLYHTGLVMNMGVSHYIPFLPLERTHVEQCLEREVSAQNQIMSWELTEQVLAEISFSPEDFVSGGCKNIGEKAEMLIEREQSRKRRFKRLN